LILTNAGTCLQLSTAHQFLKCVHLFFMSYVWMNKQAIFILYIDPAVFDSHKQRWEKDFICKENILISVCEYFTATWKEKFFVGARNPCNTFLCSMQWSVHYLLTLAYRTARQHMVYLPPKDILFHYRLPKNYITYSGTCHTVVYTDVSIFLIINI